MKLFSLSPGGQLQDISPRRYSFGLFQKVLSVTEYEVSSMVRNPVQQYV